MIVRPVTRDAANAIVKLWHSHHKPVRSHRFALGAFEESPEDLLGVVIVGNPTAESLNNFGMTMEVLRLCTNGHRNAASFLLGASWRAAKEMGVTKMVSYTRCDESGTCYKAAGWRVISNVKGRLWNTGNKSQRWLPGVYEPTTEIVDRLRWEIVRPRPPSELGL